MWIRIRIRNTADKHKNFKVGSVRNMYESGILFGRRVGVAYCPSDPDFIFSGSFVSRYAFGLRSQIPVPGKVRLAVNNEEIGGWRGGRH
jgi:hypothetical protein